MLLHCNVYIAQTPKFVYFYDQGLFLLCKCKCFSDTLLNSLTDAFLTKHSAFYLPPYSLLHSHVVHAEFVVNELVSLCVAVWLQPSRPLSFPTQAALLKTMEVIGKLSHLATTDAIAWIGGGYILPQSSRKVGGSDPNSSKTSQQQISARMCLKFWPLL